MRSASLTRIKEWVHGLTAPAHRSVFWNYNLSKPKGVPPEIENYHAEFVQVFLDFKTERVQSIRIKATLQ